MSEKIIDRRNRPHSLLILKALLVPVPPDAPESRWNTNACNDNDLI